MSDPQRQILKDSTQFESDVLSSIVSLRENGVSDALFLVNDLAGKTFLKAISPKDLITVKHRYGSGAWKTVFSGGAVGLSPTIEISGQLCGLQAYGKGIALKNMRVAREYGVQSEYSSLVSPRQILTGTGGIIPDFVHKVLDGASSGYSLNTDYIFGHADDTEIPYLPCLYESAFDSLRDLINLSTAILFPAAGLHWHCLPDGKLCLAPVGDHDVEGVDADHVVEDVWPTSARANPVVVTEDMILTEFGKKENEASHITVCGKYLKPLNDLWGEDIDLWEFQNGESGTHILWDQTYYKVGTGSIKFENNAFIVNWEKFRLKQDLNIDFSKLQGKTTVPHVVFWARKGGGMGNPRVLLMKDWSNYYYADLSFAAENEWTGFDIALYDEDIWTKTGTLTWADIHYFGFYYELSGLINPVHLWLDGPYFTGDVVRVAWDSSVTPVKMRFIRDSLSSTDSLDASDDNNPLGIAAKWELLKARRELFSGKFQIALDPDILPGQLIKVENPLSDDWPTDDGEDYLTMRIIEVQHCYLPKSAKTHLTVVDDLLSAVSQGPVDFYNAILRAVSPDYQTRDFATLKSSGVDLGLTPLVKDYAP